MRGFTIFCLLALLAFACLPERREPLPELPGLAPFLQQGKEEVEAIIDNMSLEQKLGQMIMVARTGVPEPQLHQWIANGRVGGIVLDSLPAAYFLRLQDSLQKVAPYSLISTTLGGTLFHNRFSDATALPVMDALLALSSDSMKQQLSQTFLQQADALGLSGVPAPYLSPLVQQFALPEKELLQHARNINWLNERHLLSLADGFAANALLKPVLDSLQDSLLLTFQHLAQAGLSGFWIHPSVYESPELPPHMVHRFFRERLQFDGLLLAHLRSDNQLDEILDSGVDLIVTHHNPSFVMNYLLAAFQSGELSKPSLHARLRRILLAKKWANSPELPRPPKPEPGVSDNPARTLPAAVIMDVNEEGPVLSEPEETVADYFTDRRWRYWQRRFQEEAMIVASNPDSLLPFRALAQRQFRVFHLGSADPIHFEDTFNQYAALESWQSESWSGLSQQLANLKPEEEVVIVLHNFLLDNLQAAKLLSIARQKPITLVNFQRLENLALLDTSLAIVHAFEGGDSWQELAAQALFGGISAQGKLPFTLNRFFVKGQGVELPQLRLRHGLPEQADIAPEKLVGIDAIVKTAIGEGAFPGCQIVVVKDRTVVYDKAFGYHTYSQKRAAKKNDLYDVASITKVAATTLAAMKLYEEEVVSLNKKLRKQMKMPRHSRLGNLTVKKLMTHQSGLQPHMPVVPYLLSRDPENADCSRFFCNEYSNTFPVQVANGFYFGRQYYDQMLEDVHRLRPRNQYRYSDVNFILLQQLIEEKANAPLDSLVAQSFYAPLGLQYTGFRPLLRRDNHSIVPTQHDRRWRRQLLQGYVHDETAALFGGVAGNAGLFSTAKELAVAFQMLLDGGTYGGERYLEEETIQYFTSARHGNHRGLGFDKPSKERIKKNRFPEQVSEAAFGHTGFTGTCAWVDPERGLTYIFLSNRIYPDSKNRKIFDKRVRERVHQVVYDALDTYVPEMPEM